MGNGINDTFNYGSDTRSLLTYFCSGNPNNYTKIEWLLRNGANPNFVSEKGNSCIHKIASDFYYHIINQGELKVLNLLISYNADLNLVVRNKTPLTAMSEILNRGGGPTSEEKEYVITMGIETLLKSGADPNVVTSDPLNHPFQTLSLFGIDPVKLKAINVLLNYNADPKVHSNERMSIIHQISFFCSFEGCAQTLEKAIKLAPDLLNQKGIFYKESNTPLCYAVKNDNFLSAEILLNHRANHKIPCEPSGKTPYQTTEAGSKVRQVLEKFGIHE